MGTTGIQYAVKNMFDRTIVYNKNALNNRNAAGLLATSLQANTGASGGSLKRSYKHLINNSNYAKTSFLFNKQYM
jgi:hypothetical protein